MRALGGTGARALLGPAHRGAWGLARRAANRLRVGAAWQGSVARRWGRKWSSRRAAPEPCGPPGGGR